MRVAHLRSCELHRLIETLYPSIFRTLYVKHIEIFVSVQSFLSTSRSCELRRLSEILYTSTFRTLYVKHIDLFTNVRDFLSTSLMHVVHLII